MSALAGPSRARRATHDDVETDPEVLRLISTLRAAELGSASGHPATDTDVAIQLMRQELEAYDRANADYVLAQQLQNEEEIGPGIAAAPSQIRDPAQQQRAPAPQTQGATTVQSPPTRGLLSYLGSIVSYFTASTPDESTPGIVDDSLRRPTGHDCVICQESIRGIEVLAPCGHYYDRECVMELVQASTRDETLFPPRCCRREIPLALVRRYMSQALLKLFDEKSKEFTTLRRVYCANARCARFVCAKSTSPPIFFSSAVSCPSPTCTTQTCSYCSVEIKSNARHVCTPDAQDQSVLALGEREGWARCPGCAQLIELNLGCFHMTCRCKSEFCYLCKARWKTCRCPQWDENRLLRAAEARVDAQLAAGAPPRAPRQQPVGIAVNRPNINVRRVPELLHPTPGARNVSAPRPRGLNIPAAPAPVVTRATNTLPGQVRPSPPQTQEQRQARDLTAQRTTAWAGSSNNTRPSPPPYRAVVNPPPYEDVIPTLEDIQNPALYGRRMHSSSSADGPSSWQTDEIPPLEDIRQSIPSTSQTRLSSLPDDIPPLEDIRRPMPGLKSVDKWLSAAKGKGKMTGPSAAAKRSGALSSAERASLVRAAMEDLRVNHECAHNHWTYRSGGGKCENCRHMLPKYLFRCGGCMMLACNRCRRNRL